MRIMILVFLFIWVSTASIYCSYMEYPLFNVVDESDLIIQGELTHIDYYSGEVTYENRRSLRDTAYIHINKIYKAYPNNANINHDKIRIIMPAKNRMTSDGRVEFTSGDEFAYNVGKNGIWLLKKKDNNYLVNHYQAFQLNSKEELIQELCNVNPNVLKFLNAIFRYKNSEVQRCFDLAVIDPRDPIFNYDETNPLLMVVKDRRIDLVQDIIDYGFNRNYKNENDENALFSAVRTTIGHLELIEILLNNDIDTNVVNIQGISVYDLINKCKNKEKIFELFKKYNKKQSL